MRTANEGDPRRPRGRDFFSAAMRGRPGWDRALPRGRLKLHFVPKARGDRRNGPLGASTAGKRAGPGTSFHGDARLGILRAQPRSAMAQGKGRTRPQRAAARHTTTGGPGPSQRQNKARPQVVPVSSMNSVKHVDRGAHEASCPGPEGI